MGIQNGTVNCLLETENDVASDELLSRLKELLKAAQVVNEMNGINVLPVANNRTPILSDNNASSWISSPFLAKNKSPKPATEKQISYMEKICQEQNLDPAKVAGEHGVSSIEQMDGKACWEFIKQHKKSK